MAYSELERRRRTAARTALYVGLTLSLGLLLLVLRYGSPTLDLDTDWYWVDWESKPEVQLLQRYLSVDTTSDRGNEIEGARYLAAQLEAAGIPYHLEELDDRHANLWAILEGEERDALVLHHHIDTDPIHYPDAWRWDPFGGVVDPPYIVGRGAFDMKSVGIAQLLAFLELKQSGVKPRRSVIFLATGSEEVGSDLGTRWVLRQYPELRDRMWGVVTEGGLLEMRDRGNLKFWGVEFSQKTFLRGRLESLREDLEEMGFPFTGLRAPKEVRTFLEVYAPTRDDPELAARLSRVDTILREPGEFLALSYYLRSMFRDEAVPFPVEDLGDGTYRLPIKLHLLPGTDPEEARRRLLPDELLVGLRLIRGEPDPVHRSSPLDHPLFQTAVEVLRSHHPGVAVGPVFLPWTATDARFFRAAGIPAYGFSPFLFFSSETYHLGGPNERVSLPGYVHGVELYKDLVGRITGVDLRNGKDTK
jgi:acetylornithine deacetylase/succinyl-diaminopimelate desuccinylase-like protein